MNLSLKQISELTGLKVGTLQKHVQAGHLPKVKIPGKRGHMVTPSAARKWANDRGYSLDITKTA